MASRLKHLLLVSTEDLFDAKAWSGTAFSLRAALERLLPQVTSFQPPRPRRTLFTSGRRLLFGAKRYPLWITKPTLRQNARAVQAEVDRVSPDALLSISSQCVAFLKQQSIPTFLFSDAPYQSFHEAYARWETAPRELPRFLRDEAAAAQRMDGLCFGSAWACDEAARVYSLAPSARKKLHVTLLGTNWVPSLSREQVLERARTRTPDKLRLLFVGRDWERKGGPLAVEITRLLRQRGLPATLDIVGCHPALDPAASFITVHGPLYQADPAESVRLAELFLDSHFLLVPTQAECFGIAFAEAQAFALPPVSRAVDALPSIIRDGVNGLLLPPEAPASAYADRIAQTAANASAYVDMTVAARAHYETDLTWDRTAQSIVAALERSLQSVSKH